MSWVVRMLVAAPGPRRCHRAARRTTASASPQRGRRHLGLRRGARARPVGRAVCALMTSTPSARLPLGDLSVPLRLSSDPTSALVSFVVALVVLGIQVFTAWYLRDDHRYGRFAATVSLFAAGMLLLVQAGDLVLDARRLGGHGLVLVAAHRPRQRASGGPAGRLQGLPRHPGGRHRHGRRHRRALGAGPLHRPPGGAHGDGRQHAADRRARRCRHRCRRQVGSRALPRLAPRRDGGPDPGVGPHPRGDDGRGRHLSSSRASSRSTPRTTQPGRCSRSSPR